MWEHLHLISDLVQKASSSVIDKTISLINDNGYE